MDLKRREFLKAMGLSAAGSVLPGCEREVHNLVPLVLPDEESVPGVANWYASTCRECPAACGTIVRVLEGRAKKIEGNPHHPLNRGKLCARGQAALQGLYNPDRLTGPLERTGPRGEGRFRSIAWDAAIERWVGRLRTAPAAPALLMPPRPGTLGSLCATFMAGLGGECYLDEDRETAQMRAVASDLLGMPKIPAIELEAADIVLSFGTPFLETWLSPVQFGIAFGALRQGRPGRRGRIVQIEPRLSLTAANADQWVTVRPGTEGLVALAIGRTLLDEALVPPAGPWARRLERLYGSVAPSEVSALSEVPIETIRALAGAFARAEAPLALAGGPATAHTNGSAVLSAVLGLNLLVGPPATDRTWRLAPPAEFPAIDASPSPTLLDLLDRLHRDPRRVLHVYQANPLSTMPPGFGAREAWEHADFIVSFSSYLDETTAWADLILPAHDPLESWGDHVYLDLLPSPAVALQQPVVRPRYDTRAMGDTLLAAARRLERDDDGERRSQLGRLLPWPDFESMLQAHWREFSTRHAHRASFELFWVEVVQQGGWWPAEARGGGSLPAAPPAEASAGPAVYAPPTFDGGEAEFPFYFYPYPSLALGYGEGANRPWLQELPDPLATAVWGSWVELNPRTARELGLEQGDVVRVRSEQGAVEAPLVLFPGLHPRLVCMPLGQGHTHYGRYAAGRGANPVTVLAAARDAGTGLPAPGATRVRVERVRRSRELVLLDAEGQAPSGLRRRVQ